jgi:hypothetical protein
MQAPKTSIKLWAIILAIVATILAVCILQIHQIMPHLANPN